ncbi:hypothetical protein H0266_15435 [Halobacillus locisalis]|uniref:Uncharacterized protein n=1 Tax=Halobacillus locisalis TaxID=220753 RepID=A0A838CWF0_9BACI|nr:hypothetical protein [Halobacillus locisalis]MBA2176290.1 hypothetical protein [Halobacillus locisalis]
MHRKVLFLLVGIGWLLAACSTNGVSTDEEIIKSVLLQQFTGPDQKLMHLVDDPENGTVIGNEEATPTEPTELDLYLEDQYQSYFSETMYDQFIGSYAMDYHNAAYTNGYQFEPVNIEVEADENTEGAYDFTVDVVYEKKESEERKAVVIGRVNMNTDGTITRYRLLGDSGLSMSLRSGGQVE